MNTYNEILTSLQVSVAAFFKTIAEYLPHAVGAATLIIIGWLLARLIRSLITKIGEKLDNQFSAIHERAGVKPFTTHVTLSKVIGRTAYWVVLLLFLSAAFTALGLPGVNALLRRLIEYLPNLLAAGIIMFFGYILSGFAKDLIIGRAPVLGAKQARSLATLAQVSFIVLAGLLALRQMGVDVHLIIYLIVAAAAGLFGGLGLALGLGSAAILRNMIASQQLVRYYKPGNRLKIGAVEGEIVEITRTAIVVDTADGKTLVPANLFNDSVSTLIDSDRK